jgi:hypothetical protein
MKNRPVGAELFHADEQTDRHDEANSLRTSVVISQLLYMVEKFLTSWIIINCLRTHSRTGVNYL